MHQDGLQANLSGLPHALYQQQQIQGQPSGPPVGSFGGEPIGTHKRPVEKVTVASSGRRPNHARPHMLGYLPDRRL